MVTSAPVAPAGTVTEAGTETMPAGDAATATTVPVVCAEEIVTRSVVLAPSVTVAVTGSSDTTVGGAGVTVTWLEAEEPFSVAVTIALPGATPETGMTTCVWFAANATVAGTVATPVVALDTESVPDAVGAGESVAVRLPEAPAVIDSGFGASDVALGRFG